MEILVARVEDEEGWYHVGRPHLDKEGMTCIVVT